MGTYVTSTGGINGLALCAGIGGLEFGVKLACPSYRTIAYVEGEAYAAANLVSLMERKLLDEAPIWDDIQTFDATAWRGCVDLVTAGFPCQPYSSAARGRNRQDKDLWKEVARLIHDSGPEIVFLENTGLDMAFRCAWADLRGMGYEIAAPFECSSAEVGAVHDRRRTFVLAYTDSESELVRALHEEMARVPAPPRPWMGWPDIPRVDDGLPARVDRDRALGNAVVPQQAAFAFKSLMEETFG